ncbi:SWIM zinc finger family protein [Streptomyces lavenduligriseus]|uniref:SWIM zinc finger family protein n=1 Tax=Streptomyces lavenduligriseus TaxID=67315 RepID=A0ABT0NMM2_9ACTN|nr:SWIM zinc finger family protein [Streptomyces lavenduligriseus]MCL3992431.1 SWIM zinc finger family protein [Streptomyces lavenduligriseus]
MTPPGRPHPADAARRALREARRRADTEREGTAPGSAEGEETAEGQPAAMGSVETGPGGTGSSVRTDAGDDSDLVRGAGPEPDDAGSGARTAAAVGRRPGDVAREALRAARREAARAEAEAAGSPRERRATGPARSAGSGTSSRSGQEAGTARAKAVQDMRHYLATAFRMPSWTDTAEADPEDTTDGALEDTTDGAPEGTAPAAAPPAEPAPVTPEPAETGRTAERGRTADAGRATGTGRSVEAGPSAETGRLAGTGRSAGADPSLGTSRRAEAGPSAETGHAAETGRSAQTGPTAGAAVRSHFGAGTMGMGTPHRDGELRRTFPAFPAREGGGAGERFAGTWWGNAWVGALERGALDAKRLARGRGYADQGQVDAITVTPGLVLAYVRGSRPRPYRTQVRVRTLEDADWERFLDAAADRPGHIAALLDKELPQSLADCGVPLLPGPGDLVPRCSCPDSGHPCKHAAALCYQTARLLDADPFVLLLLRGRGEKELLDALSRRSAARAARAASERQPRTLPGVRAADALAPRQLPPLPQPLPVPAHPEQPPVYPSAPGGPDPFALDQLATDAAARAHALLATGRDPVGELSLWQDAVRLAAARPGSGLTAATRTLYATLADATGRTPADLARAVAAWRQGGEAGLAVLEEPWDPPAGRFDRARPLLLAADLPAFRPWRNRLTHPRGHVQLRLGRDGLWYAYESEPGREDWWPRGTPDSDPVGALTGLALPEDL